MWERFKAAIGVEGSFGSTVFPMIAYSSANIFSGGSTYIIGIYFLSFLTEVEKTECRASRACHPVCKALGCCFRPSHGLDYRSDSFEIWAAQALPSVGRDSNCRYLLYDVVFLRHFCPWNPLYTMVYYSAAYILFSTAYTLVVVPHTAMLPELAPAYSLRTQYNSVGYLMNSVGMVSSFMLVSITLGFF